MTATPTQTLRLERTFDASPEDLWAAWTDPREYAKWFNPFPGRDAEILEWDLRVGGKVRFHMVTPDGQKFLNEGTFLALDEPRELVTGEDGMRVRVAFERVGARTRVVIEQTGLPSSVPLDDARRGWGAILDKLAAHAADEGRSIVLTRRVDAPREAVFRAWTDPAQVAQWWGPDGFRTTTRAMDARPGGAWRFTMHGPDGTDYPNLIEYDEVRAPALLRFRHGSGQGDDGFRTTVAFEEEGGGTRVTMRLRFPTAADADKVKAFGAVELGHQTLRKLAEHLAKA